MQQDPRPTDPPAVEAIDFGARQDGKPLLENINLALQPGRILAIIGPSISGKSVFLKCINRMCELEGPIETSGKLRVNGRDVYAPQTDVMMLRREVGLVFSRSSMPVTSIFDNVALGPRMAGVHDRGQLAHAVEMHLREVGLWDQTHAHLAEPAAQLSREGQQRLSIARVLATQPQVLLFDEPTAHLDYPSAGHLEDLICDLAKKYPVMITAQTPQQASHVAQDTAFFWEGKMVEFGPTEEVLTNPKDARTEAYVTGRFEG